ncbi:MAG: RNA polymerase-binding protein DksA [Hyphomicrobium sp.]|nr:RNA polymerase-binding protein DksA [Hyphomicrobium sp.]MCC7252777.1 RNA polymerase-binding protein DksA [Hyphomicrobium sp.]
MSKRATSKPAKAKAAVKAKATPKKAAATQSAASKARSAAKAPAKTKAVPKAAAPKATSKPKARTRAIDKAQDKKLTAKAGTSTIVLPPDYRPSEDEPFMNERHRIYFRQKLTAWKEEIIRQTKETLAGLHEDSTQHADLADRATSETDRALELRARDRQRKLIAKIDAALARIEDGTYGYCEETGEPIGLKRLDARPIATLSLEAQERHERRERVYRED